jgi:hypothetical protein
MSAVTFKLRGGEHLKAELQRMAQGLKTARAVRVGFLEGATYPQGDGGARLARAAKKFPEWRSLFMAWSRWQASHPTNMTVAQAAFWSEFGTSHSPPRPFFRKTISRHSGSWASALARFLRGAHMDARLALEKLGVLISEQLRASILSWPADNAPMTVAIKGFNHGLIDHGVMSRSVDYEVVGK